MESLITPAVTKLTITPAINTPKIISKKAFLIGTPKTKAAKAPVQAPVKGKGMATNKIKASSLNFWNFLECLFLVFSNSQTKKRLKK